MPFESGRYPKGYKVIFVDGEEIVLLEDTYLSNENTFNNKKVVRIQKPISGYNPLHEEYWSEWQDVTNQ
jgi:hypothetical protein